MTTNYRDAFIKASADCPVSEGEVPAKAESVAGLQYALLREHPYGFTSDELLFEVHAKRHGIAEADRDAARAAFFAKPQACLRASPLVKRHGFGLHHDGEGRVAAFGLETTEYTRLSSDSTLSVVSRMRSKRT